MKVSTVHGLYVASATEGKTAWTNREAEPAIDAVNLFEQDVGDSIKNARARTV